MAESSKAVVVFALFFSTDVPYPFSFIFIPGRPHTSPLGNLTWKIDDVMNENGCVAVALFFRVLLYFVKIANYFHILIELLCIRIALVYTDCYMFGRE